MIDSELMADIMAQKQRDEADQKAPLDVCRELRQQGYLVPLAVLLRALENAGQKLEADR